MLVVLAQDDLSLASAEDPEDADAGAVASLESVARCLAVFRPNPATIASRTLVSAPIQDGCTEKMNRAKTTGLMEASEGS
jgi:hypothetical protein